MSLWGNKDAKAQTNTATATIVVTAANTTVKGVNTKLADDFRPGDFLFVGKNNYVFTAIANNDTATVRAATSGASVVGASSNAVYTVSEKPLYITYAMDGVNANDVYGVSVSEVVFANTAQNDVAHAGWNKRTVGTGGRAGRVHFETLVAGSDITNDAADDAILPE